MICIDSTVELMISTYLGLPPRVTLLEIQINEYKEPSTSFPRLLEGLEEYARDKFVDIDLGAIE